jgi:hypothetical protein
MSRSHFLAMLPLFSILTMSPMQLETKVAYRGIASETISAHPKYEARASKIDRTKIEIDKDLDLTCFSERGEALRTRLLQERKDYKVDVVEKDAVAAQKARIDGLVSGLVDLEVDMAALKEKKAWELQVAADPAAGKVGEEIADKTMAELKTTLESLLQDEVENELAVLKDKIKKEEAVVVVKEEEPKKEDEAKTKQEELVCELEEQNKVLSKQVADLLSEQKKIMETMMGMSNMMVQMNQRMQYQQPQQYSIPSWLMSGSLINPQLQYPYLGGSPTIIMMNNGGGYNQPQDWSSITGSQLGGQNYQQNSQSGQYQLPQPQWQQPQMPQYQAYSGSPSSYGQPSNGQVGTFGSSDLSFNFGANQTI